MKTFDLQTCPLNGVTLIEASAGTGKTYTITDLFVRLIVEKSLTVDKILVVTFTEAATQELKDRVRSKLRDAIISERYSIQETERLNAAVRDFDESAIFTIHSFCRRMLREYAFESGSLFDTEVLTDQRRLQQEIVEDFWRRHFYKSSRLFVNYAMKILSPDKLLKLLKYSLNYPDIRIIPEIEQTDSCKEEKEYISAFNAVNTSWLAAKSDVCNILTNDKGLNRNKYRITSIPKWMNKMDECLSLGSDNPLLFGEFEKFTSDFLASAVKKSSSPPQHDFFNLCNNLKLRHEELEAVFEKRLLGLKIRLFQQARREMKRKKEIQNIRSFDDLLTDMYLAIEGEHGDIFAENIRGKYQAALIDEFQDTDPIQYAIFNKIFKNPSHSLFLIGDPKQAIYAFRGADVFAYMEAAKHADAAFTLEKNWRSDPMLVSAVNTIFGSHPNPFIYEEIRFQPVHAAKSDESDQPPFQLMLMKSEEAIPKNKAQRQISMSVCAEISKLLTENRAVPSDIAVLVLRNREAAMIQDNLSTLNIPSVLYSTGYLFDSYEAEELERLLSGIAEPNSERHIIAALATDIMGLSGEDLEQVMTDEASWEDRLICFREYNELWNRYGFIRMFNELMRRENIMLRMMRLQNGERRITNILHLSEVLHQASIEKKTGMTGLVKWLSQQRDPATQRLDEHQLRLETDDYAVKIVTVHKSKGLQYPIVFCPFMWHDFNIDKDMVLFHDEKRRITLDIGSGIEKNQELAERERRAENLRLLYVALTRAKNFCYLVWGWFNKCESSGMTYLFHADQTLSNQKIAEDLKNIEEKSSGNISVCDMPKARGRIYQPVSTDISEPECRKFTGIVDRSFRISSFSSLTTQQPHGAEIADYDESYEIRAAEYEASANPYSIHRFPKGAKTGIFLHDLFEHLDFNSDTSIITESVSAKLSEYGFEAHWQPAIVDMVCNVLSVPLKNGLKLSQISDDKRLNELEFYFPLNPISPKSLKQIFEKYAHNEILSDFPEQIGRLNFSTVKGFMKGFIDMVFESDGQYYLLDWKSNFLGERIEAYHQTALKNAMSRDYYILQYHLYVLALHQYLRLRIPDYRYEHHFGGVFYIFLRGVHPEMPQFGIFYDKPEEKLVNALCEKILSN